MYDFDFDSFIGFIWLVSLVLIFICSIGWGFSLFKEFSFLIGLIISFIINLISCIIINARNI
jgi:hypothetical protein